MIGQPQLMPPAVPGVHCPPKSNGSVIGSDW